MQIMQSGAALHNSTDLSLRFALLTEPSGPTCSLVVRPLETRYRWKPVRPSTGMRNKPDTLSTTNLRKLSRQKPASERQC